LNRRFTRLFELPLLTKELHEQAARPRTYVVRFLYAATLFVAAGSLFYGAAASAGNDESEILGRGRFMFERLVTFQFWSIFLFLPAISCGALTVEKERNSLGLLLITSLRPWEIVFQKVLGRVVPMLTYVLLSFPLMAVAYSYGGVTQDYLWAGTLLLVLTCLETGALSIACSAYFSTTVEAFIGNYLIFLVLFFAIPIGWGPYLFTQADENGLFVMLVMSFPMLLLTAGFLFAGLMFVESRASVPPRNVLLSLFKRLDAWFNELNSVTGGVVLVRDGDPLPGAKPIAWRETAKKSLGTFRYLFRVLVVIELPLLLICQLLRLGGPGGADLRPILVFLYIVWIFGAAMIVVHAGSLISSERSRQSLDVLLATPMTGRDIVLQKLQGVRRLIGVLCVPFLTIFLFETWWNQSATYRWTYLPLSLGMIGIYLPCVAWVALAVGLLIRAQMKAILTAMGLISLWAVNSELIRLVLEGMLGVQLPAAVQSALLVICPADLIEAVETTGAMIILPPSPREPNPPTIPWLGMLGNLALHGALWFGVRRWCLARADQLLGRLDATRASPLDRPEARSLPELVKPAAV
jgi:ABC-type transport system involved in multi-copper enzyme maturation permease subunit